MKTMQRLIDREHADRGMTLVELLVAMGILTFIFVVFMGAVTVMTKDTARVAAVGDAGDATRRVFQRFDKQVRYANAINLAGMGTAGTAYYVEYRVTPKVPGGDATCYQWRYVPGKGQLQQREWLDVSSPAVSDWLVVAKDVRNSLGVSGQYPFVVHRSDSTYISQRLDVVLDVGPGGIDDTRVGAELDATFVARNTNRSTQTNLDANADGVSDTPVCTEGIGRP
ncbi:prepilin-type N-terminal cleavage/methylation domain-containing protein [Micrococcales bacterium KH10]|nr:prepilin-type N-terminal cleavage/methylation domain-containing protein [Micrococcales bacterium KH10]